MRALALLLVACSAPAPEPVHKPVPVATTADAAVADAAFDQDATLAAIQKAMNDLDPVARQCWAAAAAERFDVEGNLEARIAIEQTATVELVVDTTRNKTLSACMVAVLEQYPWAPPLRGQTIQLPFRFRAPDGQSVIDRALVPVKTQAGISIATLLDENNTNNDAASMLEIAIAAGATTGYRQTERPELWYFLAPASVGDGKQAAAVAAGDMIYVPAKAAREIKATAGDVRAIIVMVPGGREGTARAGALPTAEPTIRKKPEGPTLLPASGAKTYGPATIYLDQAMRKDAPLAASVLQLAAGASVPEHAHASETELLYVLAGGGTMTVGGVTLPVTATSAIQIPKGVKHAFTATAATRAVQIYTPAGPEQRFKKP